MKFVIYCIQFLFLLNDFQSDFELFPSVSCSPYLDNNVWRVSDYFLNFHFFFHVIDLIWFYSNLFLFFFCFMFKAKRSISSSVNCCPSSTHTYKSVDAFDLLRIIPYLLWNILIFRVKLYTFSLLVPFFFTLLYFLKI